MIITNRNKKTNMLYKKVYGLWKHMMDRCHKPTAQNYKYYGAKGVAVDKRWHELNNFIHDIDLIKGFDFKAFMSGELELDKDGESGTCLIYSLSTCEFVSSELNKKRKPSQQRKFLGISPDGNIYNGLNQSDFAKLHNLKQGGISECLSGRLKTHRGWKFTHM